jgi:DNA-binding transcriptional ArsR family regulator
LTGLSEDEHITNVFTALKHPIRRKMLEVLSQEKAMSFSDLMRSVGLTDTGTFGFHLNVLRNLVEQNEEHKYRLSQLGKVAHQLSKFTEESEEVRIMAKDEKSEMEPLFQLSVEGTQDLEKLSLGYWSHIPPEDKEKRKKLLDFVVKKLEETEKADPKPICEIHFAQTPDKHLTDVSTTWFIKLSKTERREYIDLLVDKLKDEDKP